MSALAPGGLGAAAVAGGVVGVAEQALETRPPLDRADGVAAPLPGRRACASSPSRTIWLARARIAALEREVRELHRHLGGRLALLARAQEQRLGAVDLPRVDVAARQLEVDVGVAHLHLGALEALARLREPLLSTSASA